MDIRRNTFIALVYRRIYEHNFRNFHGLDENVVNRQSPELAPFLKAIIWLSSFGVALSIFKKVRNDTFIDTSGVYRKLRAGISILLALFATVALICMSSIIPSDARHGVYFAQACLNLTIILCASGGVVDSFFCERTLDQIYARPYIQKADLRRLARLSFVLAFPDSSFIWASILFALAIFTFVCLAAPIPLLIIAGAFTVVLLIFVADGQVHVPFPPDLDTDLDAFSSEDDDHDSDSSIE